MLFSSPLAVGFWTYVLTRPATVDVAVTTMHLDPVAPGVRPVSENIAPPVPSLLSATEPACQLLPALNVSVVKAALDPCQTRTPASRTATGPALPTAIRRVRLLGARMKMILC